LNVTFHPVVNVLVVVEVEEPVDGAVVGAGFGGGGNCRRRRAELDDMYELVNISVRELKIVL